MFVVNNGGDVSRFLDPQGRPVFNGSIAASNFSNPHWAAFVEDELFVANRGGANVLRFTFDAAGNAMSNGAITDGTTGGVSAVRANPATGELFVTDCCHQPLTPIRRYIIGADGNAEPNGFITGGGLSGAHDLAFSPWGELFVVNFRGNSISRFVFDAVGDASPSGLIVEGSLNLPLGIDFSPWGELFVANRNDGLIHRWVFDASFNATFNGHFQHFRGIHDLQFAPHPHCKLRSTSSRADSPTASASRAKVSSRWLSSAPRVLTPVVSSHRQRGSDRVKPRRSTVVISRTSVGTVCSTWCCTARPRRRPLLVARRQRP